MSQRKQNPFKDLRLTKEENQILKAIERGEYKEVADIDNLKKAYKNYAKNTLSKLKNINIRLSLRDIEKLKAKAAESGLPYQTLAASLLHQYSNDKVKVTF